MAGRKSPWGSGDSSSGDEPEAGGDSGEADAPDAPPSTPPSPGPRNPWLPPSSGEEPPRRSASIEDLFKNRPGRGGGSGGGPNFPKLPRRADGRSWGPIIAGGLIAAWVLLTSTHQLGSTEKGIVTTFGKYSHTIDPGVSLTLPWPIQNVDVREVTKINRFDIPEEGAGEKLMLTSDQNLVDLSYFVRWSIKDLKNYKFQLSDVDTTVKEVAEASMRASVAELPLSEVMAGAGRAQLEQKVRQRMQDLLDAYRSGVAIQGVDLKKVDPPANVKEAFQKVTVAQQEAQRDLSNAQADAQRIVARAQGDTAEFDKVYEQYKLAPEVTRRRMYYDTMERVLRNNDKVVVEGNNVTPYLPLPEIRRKAAEPAAGQGGGQ